MKSAWKRSSTPGYYNRAVLDKILVVRTDAFWNLSGRQHSGVVHEGTPVNKIIYSKGLWRSIRKVIKNVSETAILPLLLLVLQLKCQSGMLNSQHRPRGGIEVWVHIMRSHTTRSPSTRSHSTGSHSTKSHSTGSHSTRSHSTKSHTTRPHSTRSHSMRSHSTRSHSMRSHSTRSQVHCHTRLTPISLYWYVYCFVLIPFRNICFTNSY